MFYSSRTGSVASAICKRAGMRRPAITGRFSVQHPSSAVTSAASALPSWQTESRRSLFGFGGGKNKQKAAATAPSTSTAVLSQDDLFHPLSQSPFPEIREKAKRIKAQAYCPVSLARGQMKHVEYECPNCGWPTHYSRTEWEQDTEHGRYWPRLREVNEDEHDLRSGRELGEFNALPGQQPYEEAISMGSWDVFFYTRGFPSIDSDRSRRHVSKLLTFPITVGTVLHESSPYNTRNQRLTPEGLRSLTALRQSLHPAFGAKPSITGRPQEPIRLFILGARAESSLPPHVWQQLSHLYQPNVAFHIYFIGPEVMFTHKEQGAAMHVRENTKFGVPAYTTYVSEQLSLTSIKAPYDKVHDSFGGFDPYNDVFFSFSPGFGFPDEADPSKPQALTNWNKTLSQVLSTKAPLFCTGFSPADVERDVLALDALQSQGSQGEFDWILTPGENIFRSDKWEILEADPRVAAKANWGVWGIRGRLYEVDEQTMQIP